MPIILLLILIALGITFFSVIVGVAAVIMGMYIVWIIFREIIKGLLRKWFDYRDRKIGYAEQE